MPEVQCFGFCSRLLLMPVSFPACCSCYYQSWRAMLLVQDSFTLIIQCLQHVIIATNLVECQKMMNVTDMEAFLNASFIVS